MVSSKISSQVIMTLNDEDVKELLKEFDDLRNQGIKINPNDTWGRETPYKGLNSIYYCLLHAHTGLPEIKLRAKEIEMVVRDLHELKSRFYRIQDRVKKLES